MPFFYWHLSSFFKSSESRGSKNDIRREQNAFRRYLLDSMASRTNITCPELNVTFTNEPPFNVLGLPECASGVRPKMELYLPTGEKCLIVPEYLPNNGTVECFRKLKEDMSLKKLVLVIHGYLKSFETEWLHQFQKDIQEVDPGAAVIVSYWYATSKVHDKQAHCVLVLRAPAQYV